LNIFNFNKVNLKKKKYIILLAALISCWLTSSQEFSKDRLYVKKIFANQNNLDTILHYANKLEKSKDSCFIYEGKIHKSKYYYKKKEYQKSEKKVRTILKELRNKDNFCFIRIRIEALNRMFWIKKNQKSYVVAYKYLKKIEDEISKLQKEENYYQTLKLTLLLNKSIIESTLENHEEARGILKKCLYHNYDNHQEFSKNSNTANILNMIGESFLKSSCCHISSEIDSASLYFKKAFEITKTFKPLHNDSEILYNIRKSEILIAKKKYNNALHILKKWSSKAKELKIDKNIDYLKVISYKNLNNTDSTIYFSKKVITKQKGKNSRQNWGETLEILADQYYKNKQLDSATKYSKLAISEIKIIGKNKDEINKAHHRHEIKSIENTKDKIITKKNRHFVLFFLFVIITVILINKSPFYQSKKNKAREKKAIFNEKKRVPIPQKKSYSINPKLEQKILKGLKDLENSDNFLSSSFNLDKFAKSLKTNTSYVSYTINNQKGITFQQFYTSLRIEYIIKKLKENKIYKKYTIHHLGEIVGYKNASSFTRAFKKYKGITPSEFIKQL
jgi:AraC-like DNA-binding protein